MLMQFYFMLCNFFVLSINYCFVVLFSFLFLSRFVPFLTKGYFLPKQLSHDAKLQISSEIKNNSDFFVHCFHS